LKKRQKKKDHLVKCIGKSSNYQLQKMIACVM
jgi:hypothetical protein